LSGWREELLTADEMRAVEAAYRGPMGELMERAGRACAEACVAAFPRVGLWGVHCGGGANGGDGFVAARHLARLGRQVDVVLHGDVARLSGDTADNYERLLQLGLSARSSGAAAPAGQADGLVDALLGTGFRGELRASAAEAIASLNERAVPTVSVDVPSGVDASSGEVPGAAVRADLTVTFHRRKVAHLVAPGASYAGRVDVVDIGLDEAQRSATVRGAAISRVREPIVAGFPVRGRSDNKYSAGSVLVVGGSTGLTGAPGLAAIAALRAGAGVVVACVPASLNSIVEAQTLEVMTRPCDDRNGSLTSKALDEIVDTAGRADAVAIGPGLGRADTTSRLVRELLDRLELPVVLDADGLWALNGRIESLAARQAPTVLTPHAGELARLLERDSAEIGAQRLGAARDAAERAAAVVLLKGADTIVASPAKLGGDVLVSDLGTVGLATAGSGDVLTGVVAAALAKGLAPLEAAAASSALTGLAARAAGSSVGELGLIASDVAHALPSVLAAAAPTLAGR
jgi:NAD(P)H-hydrate epimerase